MHSTPTLLMVSALLCSIPAAASVAPLPAVDSGQLELDIARLSVLSSVLYVGAHPDDENTALLGYLARGRLVRTGYLALTRGDGGQNLLGSEKGDLLGLIRTQELLAARRGDGAEQWFTRALDFGYTKSPEETMDFWGHDEILADVVRVIRRFRPDVMMMRFPGDGRGGHGQHTASAILAMEAFRLAGDPKSFPEQLTAPENLEPWQPKRLFWDAFGARDQPGNVTLDVGTYSPQLGESFTEIAATSRSMHKSQGFGSAPRRGSQPVRLEHRLGEPAQSDLFDGVDTTWGRVPGGGPVGELLRRASAALDPAHPELIMPLLLQAWQRLSTLQPEPWVQLKRQELAEAIRAAAGIWYALEAEQPTAVPGEELRATLRAVQRSPLDVRLVRAELPFGSEAMEIGADLENNARFDRTLQLQVPATAPVSQPYWLVRPSLRGRFQVDDPTLIGEPEHHPYGARLVFAIEGVEVPLDAPLLYFWTDRVEGERWRPFVVQPELLVEIEGDVHLFPDRDRQLVTVVARRATSGGAAAVSGSVRLELPPGWSATPSSRAVELAPGASEKLEFVVTPPDGAAIARVRALVEANGKTYDQSMTAIDYPHIPVQTVFPPADSKLVRLDLVHHKKSVGYISGAGDDVPQVLNAVGYEVTQLSDEQIASGPLDDYQAIVVGVRAYNTRDALIANRQRLLDYVQAGGTLVVQYNTTSRRDDDLVGIGPYPFHVSRDRVSVEEAPITLLAPQDPVLTAPNRLAAADFDGWVQERGLNFPDRWDERYRALLSCHDPGEPERRGGLLVTNYGRGVFVYTGYSFFRQLPAGVPGALRLFVNLVEAGSSGG